MRVDVRLFRQNGTGGFVTDPEVHTVDWPDTVPLVTPVHIPSHGGSGVSAMTRNVQGAFHIPGMSGRFTITDVFYYYEFTGNSVKAAAIVSAYYGDR